MTYYTLSKHRGNRSNTMRALELGYITSIKNTEEFKEFIQILNEALEN